MASLVTPEHQLHTGDAPCTISTPLLSSHTQKVLSGDE
jgi:hypothetical protein